MEKEKVELGQLVMTRAVAKRCEEEPSFHRFVFESLGAYVEGDWGDTCDEDKERNDSALKTGERLLAVYHYKGNENDRLWIITEWDRSATTILFPEDY